MQRLARGATKMLQLRTWESLGGGERDGIAILCETRIVITLAGGLLQIVYFGAGPLSVDASRRATA
jgi:hypothetical protein